MYFEINSLLAVSFKYYFIHLNVCLSPCKSQLYTHMYPLFLGSIPRELVVEY